ncbi:hypothetical protein MKEN_00011100 [Mycena kentingensis (nom. inval.)]|nr:hypothetical protein MKEN_00011100 [Mycena kentingensis (nom. inval.)]
MGRCGIEPIEPRLMADIGTADAETDGSYILGLYDERRLVLQMREVFPDGCLPTAARLIAVYVLPLRAALADAYISAHGEHSEENALVGTGHLRKSISGLVAIGLQQDTVDDALINLRNLEILHTLPSLQPTLIMDHPAVIVTDLLVHVTSFVVSDPALATAITRLIYAACRALNTFLAAGCVAGIATAVERGLLTALVRASVAAPRLFNNPDFLRLATVQLTKYCTVYLSVLRPLQHEFLRIKDGIPPVWAALGQIVGTHLARPHVVVALAESGTCGVPSCTKPANKRCTACLSVSYCSSGCQSLHWDAHKQDCSAHPKVHTRYLSPADERFVAGVLHEYFLEPQIRHIVCNVWQVSMSAPIMCAGVDFRVFPPKLVFEPLAGINLQPGATLFAVMPVGEVVFAARVGAGVEDAVRAVREGRIPRLAVVR